MKISLPYENYPWSTVLLSNLQNLILYFLGLYVIAQISIWIMIPFLFYLLFLEFKLLRNSCTKCYYYGKVCAFGKGRLSALLFKKGDTSQFNARCITWKYMIPDLLVTVIPFVAGIYLLIKDFSWPVLGAIVAILLLSSMGNAYIRGNLACKYCKQKDLGCPAYDLFNK